MPLFNTPGRLLALKESGSGWKVFDLGGEGKPRPATDVMVPNFVSETELAQCLGNLPREHASPKHPNVIRVAY